MSGYAPSASSGRAAVGLHYCRQNARVLNNAITSSEVGVSVSSLLSVCVDRPVESRGNTLDTIGSNAVRQ